MSELTCAAPVKLVVSVLSSRPTLIAEALRILSDRWGLVDFVSPRMPFPWTKYYELEMGVPLGRRFASFEPLIRPEHLPDIKRETNGMEDRFSEEGARKVNIDPGYISAAHLVLATGKGYSHRPYLRDGVYADLTLLYQGGTFTVLPWTYPDYAHGDAVAMFNRIRERYLVQLKTGRGVCAAGDERGVTAR
jgi:hypothetical protein